MIRRGLFPLLHFVNSDALNSLEAYDAKNDWDSTIIISENLKEDRFVDKEQIDFEVDKSIYSSVTVHYHLPSKGHLMILSPTGPTNRDFDDVRAFASAARAGVARAVKAGCKAPILYLPSASKGYERALEVIVLAVYQELYRDLQGRELYPEKTAQVAVSQLGFSSPHLSDEQGQALAATLAAIEAGKYLARDLGGADSERMTPVKFTEYLQEEYKHWGVKNVAIEVIETLKEHEREYPLLNAVARATTNHPSQEPRVVRMEYRGDGPITDTLYLVGKGVCYDTGGADLKTGGIMPGMSRDKCGAANFAGFMLTTSMLKPKHLNIVAYLGLVKNSVGPLMYVSDEIIRAHSGVCVKVMNTDAEGRFVMADCLSHCRAEAIDNKVPNPQFLTMATLTGHAGRSFGPYTVLFENGPAKKNGTSLSVQSLGESWGDPFEIASFRKEDHDYMSPGHATFDVLQVADKPARGSHCAASFLRIASGLAKHGNDSTTPLPYVHYDIAPSACENSDYKFGKPTACCVTTLTAKYLLADCAKK